MVPAPGSTSASRDLEPARSEDKKDRAPAGVQGRLFKIVCTAAFDLGKPLPKSKNVPGNVTMAITRDQLKKALQEKGFFDPDAADNIKRRKMSEALNALAAKGYIGMTETHVWPNVTE
jgi:hypothetical protein